MLGKPFSSALLFLPAESTLRVLGEFDIIWRIGVDEIVRPNRELREVSVRELEGGEDRFVFAEL